ncbi:MAG: 50S ribosomal protein L35 [Ruminococcaceae bacterium]|nr:50S ribosomal protein L35 [Oscillospiraceae bacterium]
MMKVKSHRASAKRFSLTKSGKVKINHSHHRHNLGLKSQKRKRHLRTGTTLHKSMAPTVRAMILK